MMRRNPLKRKLFDKRVRELDGLVKTISRVPDARTFGLSAQQSISNMLQQFNTEVSDPSHATYMLDWWKARLSLELFIETNDSRYYDDLSRYIAKYKIDPYELGFDTDLSTEVYEELFHFAQMAAVEVAYQEEWPKIPPRELIKKLRALAVECASKKNKYFIPKENEVVMSFDDGSEWVIVGGKTGWRRWDIHPTDTQAEADSLKDCAQSGTQNSIVLSLRQPGPKKTKQSKLHLDISYPFELARVSGDYFKRNFYYEYADGSRERRQIYGRGPSRLVYDEPEYPEKRRGDIEFIKQIIYSVPGIANQLRGVQNSAPRRDLVKYIIPLLTGRSKDYLGVETDKDFPIFIAQFSYSQAEKRGQYGGRDFKLDQLTKEELKRVKRINKELFSERKFLEKLTELKQIARRRGNYRGYPDRAIQRIRDRITLSPEEIIPAISAPRFNPEKRNIAIKAASRRLRLGKKYKEKEIVDALETFMLTSRNRSMISDCANALKGNSNEQRVIANFMISRYELVLEDSNYEYFESYLKKTRSQMGLATNYLKDVMLFYCSIDDSDGLRFVDAALRRVSLTGSGYDYEIKENVMLAEDASKILEKILMGISKIFEEMSTPPEPAFDERKIFAWRANTRRFYGLFNSDPLRVSRIYDPSTKFLNFIVKNISATSNAGSFTVAVASACSLRLTFNNFRWPKKIANQYMKDVKQYSEEVEEDFQKTELYKDRVLMSYYARVLDAEARGLRAPGMKDGRALVDSRLREINETFWSKREAGALEFKDISAALKKSAKKSMEYLRFSSRVYKAAADVAEEQAMQSMYASRRDLSQDFNYTATELYEKVKMIQKLSCVAEIQTALMIHDRNMQTIL